MEHGATVSWTDIQSRLTCKFKQSISVLPERDIDLSGTTNGLIVWFLEASDCSVILRCFHTSISRLNWATGNDLLRRGKNRYVESKKKILDATNCWSVIEKSLRCVDIYIFLDRPCNIRRLTSFPGRLTGFAWRLIDLASYRALHCVISLGSDASQAQMKASFTLKHKIVAFLSWCLQSAKQTNRPRQQIKLSMYHSSLLLITVLRIHWQLNGFYT